MPTQVFFNEFHYDNVGTDTGEFIEIAGPAGTDLTGWSIVLYNGNGGASYTTSALGGVIADQQNGYGTVTVTYPSNGIQNGDPDGFALVDNNGVVRQFLSYEGSFTATSGPASGVLSTDIGVFESSSTPAGHSLQLSGTGTTYEDFSWNAPTSNTAGNVNSAQSFQDGPPPPVEITRIYTIQGAGHTSALNGQIVTTEGIVTAVDSNGFYLQDAAGDGDDATSDAIFVFTSIAPSVAVGDELQVRGSVAEFLPGGTATNLTITELTSPIITTLSTGNALPASTILGEGGRLAPTEVIDDDAFAAFDPAHDGIDFYESLEGMRVTVQDAVAVGPTNSFGEIFVVTDGGANATGISERGTINVSPDDFNPERIQIDDDTGLLPGFTTPVVSTGAQLGDVTGIVSYSFGNYEILATETYTPVASTLTRESTSLVGTQQQLTVATFNTENLDAVDAAARFDAIAALIVDNLGLPDVISLEEIQDNDGATNSSITAADGTLQQLIAAIEARSGVRYDFIDNPFIADDTNGGELGGNIRVTQIYNPERVDLQLGSIVPVTDPVTQTDGVVGNSPFDSSRPPLSAQYTFNGETVTVIGNHFTSKGGSAPLFGSIQPAVGDEANGGGQQDPAINSGVDIRTQQAQEVKAFVDALLAEDADANIVVAGDLNDFQFLSPLTTLTQSLTDLIDNLPKHERYTYVYEGNSQALDHLLVSNALAGGAEVDVLHVNSEFADQFSDHDPIVSRLSIAFDGTLMTGSAGNEVLNGGTGADWISAGAGNDVINGHNGNDRIDGEDGNDAVQGGVGDDRLAGNRGNDALNGGAGADTLLGGIGNDTLTGAAGDDQLDGGLGDDRILSGGGSDFIVLRPGDGSDTIVGYTDGEDRFLLVNGIDFADLTIAYSTNTTISYSDAVIATLLGVTSGLGAEDFVRTIDDASLFA